MVKLGWGKQTFKPGDEVTVTFIAVKNGLPVGRVQQVVLANARFSAAGSFSHLAIQFAELNRNEISIQEGT